MPVYELRNRVEILRQMVARTVARSALKKLRSNGAVFHILAAAAQEDGNIYFQLAQLRDLFSLDRCTGSDLDERAREIQPGLTTRRLEVFATTNVVFGRVLTVGAIPIPLGTLVAASDSQGRILYRTTAAGSIPDANTVSASIPVVASIAGERANVDEDQINQLVSRIPGVLTVRNPSAVASGLDRELDDQFRQRIKDGVSALARGTVPALEAFARSVSLVTGQRVIFAKLFEPVVPSGQIFLYIDDGTGTVETTDDTFVGGLVESDTVIASASGGEIRALTSARPQKDDGDLKVYRNAVQLIRGVDFEIDPTRGQIEFLPSAFPAGLTAGDLIQVNYRLYTGLIQEVQRVISGDPLSALTHPGVEAGGVTTLVRGSAPVFQTLTASVVTLQGFDLETVKNQIKTAILNYINNLNIGADVIVSEIIEQAMGVNGVFNFKVTSISGTSPPTDQVILDNQAARVQSGDIVIN
jgi:uncharacterized phage protein gp47/JayE